jgi:4-diphosphocytidyl-2-C-methyl-D-erythritol kinase
MPSIRIKAYAKVNLGLSVIGRREDGFHELRTIYQSISLADDLEVSVLPASSKKATILLECSGISVPGGRDNLAVRAAEILLDELKVKRNVQQRMRKNIPTGSGLGGASSDAAAVMRALLHLLKLQLTSEKLFNIAAKLGSDVPFFLWGGKALGVGRGEEIYPLEEDKRRFGVVVYPRASISTPEAYQQLHLPALTRQKANPNIELFCGLVNGAKCEVIGNDFERVVFPAIRGLRQVKRSLLSSGAEIASLTGSGSAVFGLFANREKAIQAAQNVRKPGMDVYAIRTISRREFSAQTPGHIK